MTTRTATFRKNGITIQVRANWANAASPIEYKMSQKYDQGEWMATQYQVADARHSPANACRLCAALTGCC